MIESTPEGGEARLEPFTPAERAVMAARAEAAEWRAEAEKRGGALRAWRYRAQVAEARAAEAEARLADLARQATAAGPVLENSDEVASAAVDMGDYYHVRADVFEGFLSAVAALRAAREGK